MLTFCGRCSGTVWGNSLKGLCVVHWALITIYLYYTLGAGGYKPHTSLSTGEIFFPGQCSSMTSKYKGAVCHGISHVHFMFISPHSMFPPAFTCPSSTTNEYVLNSPTKTVTLYFWHINGLFCIPDLYLYGRKRSGIEETSFLYLTCITWISHSCDLKADWKKKTTYL